eukprot:gene3969-4964_t
MKNLEEQKKENGHYFYSPISWSNSSYRINDVSKYLVAYPPQPNAQEETMAYLKYFPKNEFTMSDWNSGMRFNFSYPQYTFYENPKDIDPAIVNFYKDNYNAASESNWNYTFWYQNQNYIPAYSGIYFNNIDLQQKKLNFTLENFANSFATYGNPFYPSMFVTSEKLDVYNWELTGYLSQTLLQYITNTTINFGGTVTNYYELLNFTPETLTYFMAIFMFPVLITFIFPVFVYNLVYEKHEKQTQIMSMMGLKPMTYTIANALFFFSLYVIIFILVMFMGLVGGLGFMLKDTGKFILLLVLYGMSMVSFSFFVAALFWRPKPAVVISYIVSLLTPAAGVCIDFFGFSGSRPILPFLFYPPFAYIHGLYTIFLKQNGSNGSHDYLISFSEYSQLSEVLVALLVETIVFLLLGVYLGNVLPKEHGYKYPVTYPITSLVSFFKKSKKSNFSSIADGEDQHLFTSLTVNNQDYYDDEVYIKEDTDCKEERHRANSQHGYLLKAVNLKKVYTTGGVVKEALVNFCLTSNEGEILGLLGPNGAGKTTFIHIVSGMYKPTSGDAYVNGYRVSDQMDKIYEFLGFCPQHDILYDDLTIFQHLDIYASLKGLYNYDSNNRRGHIFEILRKVRLYEHRLKRVNQLSGGMKRRVSIAISLLGHNKLVLLDEPTTGLDPDSRRALWDIIQEVKHDKTILLCTHNMEEADTLCNKIAIVASGQLQCVGSPIHLKNRFGSGYRLETVPYNDDARTNIKNTIMSYYPAATIEPTINDDQLIFLIPKDSDITILLTMLSNQKDQLGIKEYGIMQTSLEDVFMKMVEKEEVK